MNETEYNLFLLRCLLNYHERVMMFSCGSTTCQHEGETGPCELMRKVTDPYALALKEAIRCIEIVHADEITAPADPPAARLCSAYKPIQHTPYIP